MAAGSGACFTLRRVANERAKRENEENSIVVLDCNEKQLSGTVQRTSKRTDRRETLWQPIGLQNVRYYSVDSFCDEQLEPTLSVP